MRVRIGPLVHHGEVRVRRRVHVLPLLLLVEVLLRVLWLRGMNRRRQRRRGHGAGRAVQVRVGGG